MINGTAFILMLIVMGVTAWCAYSVGYDEGQDQGYSEGWAARGGDF